jgi:hypothetical protein
MKRVFLFLITLLSASAAEIPTSLSEMPQHSFRKVEGTYYDLRPLYKWLKTPDAKDRHRQFPTSNPMPDWLIAEKFWFVRQTLDGGGLLLHSFWYDHDTGQRYDSRELTFLSHYPYAKEVSDGQQIVFIAKSNGTFRYQDVAGAIHTVRAYDYGIPYDPNQLAAERSRTNAAKNNAIKMP